MHEYSVELRIAGAGLIVEEVSNKLQLTPSFVREGGSPDFNAVWGYNGSDDFDEPRYWRSLDSGLEFLIEKLLPAKTQIDQYKEHYQVYFWCGHFHAGFDGGPFFSASLLKNLADFGVEVYIDTYFVNHA